MTSSERHGIRKTKRSRGCARPGHGIIAPVRETRRHLSETAGTRPTPIFVRHSVVGLRARLGPAALSPRAGQPRASLHHRRVRVHGLRWRAGAGKPSGSRSRQRWQVQLAPPASGGWHAGPATDYDARARTARLGRWPCGSSPVHNKHCAFAPSSLGRTFILFVEQLPAAQAPAPRNKGSHNIALWTSQRRHRHAACSPPAPGGSRLPSSRCSPRASLPRHPSRHPPLAWKKCRDRDTTPKPPPNPDARPLPSPSGRRQKHRWTHLKGSVNSNVVFVPCAQCWYLLVGVRWQRWPSVVSGLYYRRVTLPVQFWVACGHPAAFRPALP